MDAYARPAAPAAGSASRIAIVVGGIGIARDGSSGRSTTCPATITLAFAPYSDDLPRSSRRRATPATKCSCRSRSSPMAIPNNDPGPHTLTVDASAEENLDRLHWLMAG